MSLFDNMTQSRKIAAQLAGKKPIRIRDERSPSEIAQISKQLTGLDGRLYFEDGTPRPLLTKYKTFAGKADNIATAIEQMESVCVEAAAEATARGVTMGAPPVWKTAGVGFSAFEDRCYLYCEAADTAKRPTTAPVATPALPTVYLPEVIGNESWRPAVEKWESLKVEASALIAVPANKAPGVAFSADREKVDAHHCRYFEGRIDRLRFEIKRAGGQTMKALEPRQWETEALHSYAYRAWQYAFDLSCHLSALLNQHTDQKLAAQVRAENFKKS